MKMSSLSQFSIEPKFASIVLSESFILKTGLRISPSSGAIISSQINYFTIIISAVMKKLYHNAFAYF